MQYGLPIRQGFWNKNEVKPSNEDSSGAGFMRFFGRKQDMMDPVSTRPSSKLGLDEDLPTVLIVGGGDGMGGIVNIASTLGEKLGESSDSPACQMVVVCGNNEAARNELSNKRWGPGVKVRVEGFVNNMDEWMNASDALVTKAGPGTIAEASICGLPCMLFAYL